MQSLKYWLLFKMKVFLALGSMAEDVLGISDGYQEVFPEIQKNVFWYSCLKAWLPIYYFHIRLNDSDAYTDCQIWVNLMNKINKMRNPSQGRRNREVLQEAILENVELGTHIITDQWAGYNKLHTIGYSHSTVNHRDIK